MDYINQRKDNRRIFWLLTLILIKNLENDIGIHKNDTKSKWKSKIIVDNFVEIGDFSKKVVHVCHFYEFKIQGKLSENLKKYWIGQ